MVLSPRRLLVLLVFAYAANRQPPTLAQIRRVKRKSIGPAPAGAPGGRGASTAANCDNTVAAQRLAEELGVPLNVHLHESPADPATTQPAVEHAAGIRDRARVPDMHARNMKIGLGLDGGTDDGSDMFADMKAAAGLHREQARVIADAQAASDRIQKLLGRNPAERASL